MRLYLTIPLACTFTLALLTSVSFTSLTFSQTSPTQGPASSPTKPHLVKILSPSKGQQVPVGKDLAVSGTSATNSTAGCGVSVKVNSISPYQKATPLGVGGTSDYSKWNFTLSPTYTTIKPGQNKITAKFSCANNPALTSHYSVNVTGVGNAATNSDSQQQLSSVTTPGLNSTTAAAAAATSNPSTINITPINSSNSNYTRPPVISAATLSSSGNNSNNLGTLFVSVNVSKNTLHPGDKQTLTTFVADKTNSSKSIAGALVSGSIANPSGGYKKLEGTTDDQGKASYSWTVSNTGTYKVLLDVSAPNYENYSTSKAFRVTSVSSTSSSDSSSSDSSFSHSTSESTNGNHHKDHVSTTTSTTTTAETSTSDNTKGDNHKQFDGKHIGNSRHQHGNGWGAAIDPNVNGLAQKIINNVKNKLRMQGIFLH